MARQEFEIELDFSFGSIEKVEDILDALSDELRAQPASDTNEEVRQRFALMFGAYVGEVLRQRWEGRWVLVGGSDPASGALQLGRLRAFPIRKVYERLRVGPEENVWHFSRVLERELPEASG